MSSLPAAANNNNGRLFHMFAVATMKAWLPIIRSRVGGTARAEVEDEQDNSMSAGQQFVTITIHQNLLYNT